MDFIAKLFQKITKEERALLNTLSDALQNPSSRKTLNITKLEGSDFYRLRKGHFRIIFHIEKGEVVIDSIRMRSEKTYRGY
jgi:mRNA-degrading endonuclease RelE of RelBE toxin-antitoxin system